MPLARSFRETMANRGQQDPAFRAALAEEADLRRRTVRPSATGRVQKQEIFVSLVKDRVMPLTRSFRETVANRVQQDPAFRAALVEEAAQNILDGDVETALGQLRDIVNATIGFDGLAAATGAPKTSLMRMLGPKGNPRADNLGAILKALGQHTGVSIVARAEPAGCPAPV